MIILGISSDYHDSAAALVVDGEIVAAVSEERFSRKKNDSAFPERAISHCLKTANLPADAIDGVAYYEDPLKKFNRIVRHHKDSGGDAVGELSKIFLKWTHQERFQIKKRIYDKLSIEPEKIEIIGHHRSHAASSFFCSPFKEATVVTLDGVGEDETACVWRGGPEGLIQVSATNFPNSIGLLYSVITAYLGFEVNEGEYKVMGMAPYGQPKYADFFEKLYQVKDDGSFTVDTFFMDLFYKKGVPFNEALIEKFGPARIPESDFDPNPDASDDVRESSLHYADIAASLQKATENVILEICSLAIRNTGVTNLCLAGGVALNSVANGKLKKELGVNLYIQPAAGDAGTALGAALDLANELGDGKKFTPLTTVSLGSCYSDYEIREALIAAGETSFEQCQSDDELTEKAAELLNEGKIIGWFQGRSEWGPRSLGYRSILASPLGDETRDIVNEKIKFRELFRPFAPSVIAESTLKYFEIDGALEHWSPESFMLLVCQVREAHKSKLLATTHVDGSARVHTVYKETNALYHQLIKRFGQLSDYDVLLNSSFNRRGEPIVETPANAIKTFQWSGLDCLVCGPFIVRKPYLT